VQLGIEPSAQRHRSDRRAQDICCNDYPRNASKSVEERKEAVIIESAKLEIIWRNPQPVRRRQRWEAVEVGSSSSLYIVQEFLSTGEYGFWNTTCRLQVFSDCGGAGESWRRRAS